MTLIEYEKIVTAMGSDWMLRANDKLDGRRPIDCSYKQVAPLIETKKHPAYKTVKATDGEKT